METRTISDVVSEMMSTPMRQLPKPAIDYLKHLSSMMGFCGEVCVTAYYHYLQAIDGMECKDDGYKLSGEDKIWWDKYKANL
jgi:hypothetical protein